MRKSEGIIKNVHTVENPVEGVANIERVLEECVVRHVFWGRAASEMSKKALKGASAQVEKSA